MIQSISRGCKGTLSDGSVRYVFEFGPNDAADAAKLFGMPGTPSLCSAFTVEAAQRSAQDETIKSNDENWEWAKSTVKDGKKEVVVDTFDKPKGGALAKLAGIWCSEPNFWEWLNQCGVGLSIDSSIDARYAIYEICTIESRAELDHNPEAADKFHRLIREPYSEYLRNL